MAITWTFGHCLAQGEIRAKQSDVSRLENIICQSIQWLELNSKLFASNLWESSITASFVISLGTFSQLKPQHEHHEQVMLVLTLGIALEQWRTLSSVYYNFLCFRKFGLRYRATGETRARRERRKCSSSHSLIISYWPFRTEQNNNWRKLAHTKIDKNFSSLIIFLPCRFFISCIW